MIKELLYDTDEKRILRRSGILNSMAGVISSAFSSLLLIVITNAGDLELAGVFSIASVIAYQCLTIGRFSTYNVQASDTNKEFTFNDFVGIRLISMIFMILVLFYYSFCSGYDVQKAIVVFSFGLFKSSDVVDDIFRAEYHRNKRLDVASIVLLGRYVLALLLFSVLFVWTKDLVISSSVSAILLLIFTLWMHNLFINSFVSEKKRPEFRHLKELCLILLPLTFSNYLRTYLCNIPKYAIDAVLSVEYQTYFSILIMPAMVINLLADIVFAPYIPLLSKAWTDDFSLFKKMILRQVLTIVGITGILMLVGAMIGLDFLSLIYSVNLDEFIGAFLLILIAGGFNAASIFLQLVLTIQRKQKMVAVLYFVITFFVMLIANPIVLNYGIHGASALYAFICFLNFVSFLLLAFYRKKIGVE